MSELSDVLESTNLPGSPEKLESGSFNASEGEMPFGATPAEGETQEPGTVSEEAPADKTAGELEQLRGKNADLDAKLTHSRQEIANYKTHLSNLTPIIEAGMEARGETPKQAQQPQQKATQGQQQATIQATFLEQLRSVVREEVASTFDQKNFDSRQMDKLESRASKEIEGFDKMREHPLYIDLVNQTIFLQNRGTLEKKDDNETYSAMMHARDMFLASNPEYMKAVKETGKKEALDKAEKKAVAASAGGTSKSAEVGGEERPATEEQRDMVKILEARHGGRKRLPHAPR